VLLGAERDHFGASAKGVVIDLVNLGFPCVSLEACATWVAEPFCAVQEMFVDSLGTLACDFVHYFFKTRKGKATAV
jgi:hypothetical protein